jgi:hypothetical protein
MSTVAVAAHAKINTVMTSLGHRHLLVICLAGLMALASSTAQDKSQPSGKPSLEIAKIKVTQAGRLYLNKKRVSWDDLSKHLTRLKKANGAIWYFRESPQDEPTKAAMAIFRKIVAFKLPIKLVDRDFE